MSGVSNNILHSNKMNALRRVGFVKFPPPKGINVNMMPFVIGDPKSIPSAIRDYYSIIEACPIPSTELGKIGYISVSESVIPKNNSQRRPGIHTERSHPGERWGGWGRGCIDDEKLIGGIYMSSTLDDTCRAWDVNISNPGHLGDCEHMRDLLTDPILFKKNELYWMTDSCPHESLPVEEDVYRQWMRFITSRLSVWYEDHSTPNPLGILPNCEIIKGNKFA